MHQERLFKLKTGANHQNSIFFDTNLLILYVIGLADRNIVEQRKHKKIEHLGIEMFDLLKDFANDYDQILVTPHVLAEASNLICFHKDPEKSKAIASEIMRGIQLTTGMKASIDDEINSVLLECESETMAAWMHRAIVAENVFADHLGNVVRLPSGPDFRIEKEIKNVIVCVAKTWHYWDGHMSENEKAKAGKVMNDATLIIPPQVSNNEITTEAYAKAVIETLETVGAALKFEGKTASEYGWVGFECPDEKSAAWMVRAIIACNILARREITTLLLPVFISPVSDYPLARMFDFLTAIRNVYEHQLEMGEV